MDQREPSASPFVGSNRGLDRQLAYDGKLPIWGKKFAGDTWRPIPPAFWADHQLDWFGYLKGTPEDLKTTAAGAYPGDKSGMQHTWSELMTSKAKVEELWPPR